MLDPVIATCAAFCAAGLLTAWWGLRKLSQARTQENMADQTAGDPPPAGQRPPKLRVAGEEAAFPPGPASESLAAVPEASAAGVATMVSGLRMEMGRIVETIKTFELTHLEALRILSTRLDALEEASNDVSKEIRPRLEALEKTFNQAAAKDAFSEQPIEKHQPPPFV